MIVLLTDFGIGSPYMGMLHAALFQAGGRGPVIDLHADLPCFQPKSAAYLLAAYIEQFPPGSVFLCVLDPGVGSMARLPVAVQCQNRWLVGPDNGLFAVLPKHFPDGTRAWHLAWQPARLSATFHGRDLFAPVAARLSRGNTDDLQPYPDWPAQPADWPADLAEIIYVDHYGNLYTGLRASHISPPLGLILNGQVLPQRRTYNDVPSGVAFCYTNSIGLLEIAVNQDHAARQLQAGVGSPVALSA